MAKDFLAGLDSSAEKFAFQFRDDVSDREPSRISHATLDKIWQAVEALNTPAQSYGIYVLPNFPTPRALIAHANNDEQVASTQLSSLQKDLSTRLGTDPTVMPRVRLPGTLNLENPDAPQLVLLGRNGASKNWKLDDLLAKLKLSPAPLSEPNDGRIVAEFLQKLRPSGLWVLTAIVPDGLTTTSTARAMEQIEAFVRKHDGKQNLYYSVNPTRTAMSKKAKKTNIAAIEYIHFDGDPRDDETPEQAKARYLKAIEESGIKFTFVIDSGNGIQGLIRLTERIELGPLVDGKLSPEDQAKIDDIEARTKALTLRLGGDIGTQNIDRILRLPDTTNLPNAKKRKAGRTECQAKLLWSNDASYPLDAFPLNKEKPNKNKPNKKEPDKQGSRLPAELRNMLRLVGTQPVGDYPSRSHLLWAFIHTARRRGVDENKIVDVCLDETYRGCAIYEHVQEQGGEDYIKRQIERAVNSDPLVDEQQRSLIRIEGGKLDEQWRAVQRELIDRGCPVYVRGNRLVQPLWRWEKADDREVLTAQFVPYNVARLADMVAHHAVKFQKFDGRSNKWKNIDPPDKLIEHIIEAKQWDFLTIVGIINTPTMRKDGSLLTTEGYDPATQLWFKSSGDVTLPPIPDTPSKEDALRALALLDELLEEFPFDGGIAHSAALSALMTPVLRGALPVAVPIFAIIATEPRSGKTYLVHLIATIATGHTPVPAAGAEKPEEMEKRIETAALSGRPIMHLNNLPNGMVVESVALAQLCTEGMVSIRKLGRHEEGVCDCRATTTFLNGNNIVIAADLVPRIVMSRLDPQLEQPENRTFKGDPIEQVRADRGKYLAAVFTIVRAYKAAGCPPQEHKVVAGFEAWSRLVQQPLIWLGKQDPYGSMDELKALDPKQEELRALLGVLRKYFKADAIFTVADCWQKAEETEFVGTSGSRWQHTNQDLREVMTDQYGKVDQRSFGKKLMRHRDRICDGWRVEVVTDSKQTRVSVFRLRQVWATDAQSETAQPGQPQEASPREDRGLFGSFSPRQ
jgi:putative DNA primase/helicase